MGQTKCKTNPTDSSEHMALSTGTRYRAVPRINAFFFCFCTVRAKEEYQWKYKLTTGKSTKYKGYGLSVLKINFIGSFL